MCTPSVLSVSFVFAMMSALVILAQTQPPKPAPAQTGFEVASIRPSTPMPQNGTNLRKGGN